MRKYLGVLCLLTSHAWGSVFSSAYVWNNSPYLVTATAAVPANQPGFVFLSSPYQSITGGASGVHFDSQGNGSYQLAFSFSNEAPCLVNVMAGAVTPPYHVVFSVVQQDIYFSCNVNSSGFIELDPRT